jgi:GTPase SAR1 family protein
MMSTPRNRLLLLGLANSGKTTLLIQFFGRLKSNEARLQARGTPDNLARIEAGLRRLNMGLPVEHTPAGDGFTQSLPATSAGGREIDIELPDYSGEELKKMVQTRRLDARWREYAQDSDHWVLLLRPSEEVLRPDVLHNPVGALAMKAWSEEDVSVDQLPLDMWGVELLQMLRYARAEVRPAPSPPRLTLALSCWDELEIAEGRSPTEFAQERLALLDSYCRAHWSAHGYTVLGVSALGQALDSQRPSDNFVDNGPEQMGWLVLPDGTRDRDLTLIADLD